jgi:PAS domain S-box-containing protein
MTQKRQDNDERGPRETNATSGRAAWWPRVFPYGFALLCAGLAFGVRLALVPALGPTRVPFITFYLAVVVAAWVGGFGPGALCLVFSALLADFYFLEPVGSFAIVTSEGWYGVALFLLTGAGIVGIGGAQRRATLLSRERERLMSTTLHSIGDAVLVTDREGRVTMMNAVAERMTGWTESGARGLPHTDIFRISREGTGELVESPVDRVLREGVIVGLANHTVLTARDGTVRAIADSGAPVRAEDGGETRGVVLVFRDVTNERQEESRARFLLRLNERTRAHTDPDAILEEIVRGIGEYLGVARCLYAEVDAEADSAVIRRDYCVGVESMVGSQRLSDWGETAEVVKGGENLVLADTRTDARSAPVYESAYAPFGIRASLTVPLHKDGKLVAVLAAHHDQPRPWSVSNIRLLGDVLEDTWLTLENARLYRAAQEEIVERRRAEAERERSLNDVRALNERLRYAMSETHHRVKNNLQVISALVGMHLTGDATTVSADTLQQLNQHIRSLAAIHDILTTQARADGSAQDISVLQTLSRLQPMLQEMTDGRQVTFDVEECRMPIRQSTTVAVLVNELVSNAMKHGRGDVEVRFTCREEVGVLSVTDGGDGFPEGFDARAAANTGLELVESLVQWDLQGAVRYENAPGGRVVVTFPLPDSPA